MNYLENILLISGVEMLIKILKGTYVPSYVRETGRSREERLKDKIVVSKNLECITTFFYRPSFYFSIMKYEFMQRNTMVSRFYCIKILFFTFCFRYSG